MSDLFIDFQTILECMSDLFTDFQTILENCPQYHRRIIPVAYNILDSIGNNFLMPLVCNFLTTVMLNYYLFLFFSITKTYSYCNLFMDTLYLQLKSRDSTPKTHIHIIK